MCCGVIDSRSSISNIRTPDARGRRRVCRHSEKADRSRFAPDRDDPDILWSNTHFLGIM